MQVVINGDDFGLTKGVTNGIIRAIKDGVMTDTSAMTNMPYFDDAIKIAKINGINEMGIHLTLTCGKPLLPKDELNGLIDDNGYFHKKPDPNYINVKAAEKELRAQICKFIKTGMKLNHIDAHHHFYVYDKEYLNLIIKLAKEYNVPIRCLDTDIVNKFAVGYGFDPNTLLDNTIRYVRNNGVKCPEHLIVEFYDDGVSEEKLIKVLEECIGKYEVVEVMSHPAIVDNDLIEISSYTSMREKELKVLTSTKIKEFIKNNNIELINYSIL